MADEPEPNASDRGSPVTVFRAAEDTEAAMIVGLLADHGIEAHSTGEFTAAFRAETQGDVSIVVHPRDERRSRELIDRVQRGELRAERLTHFDDQGASRMVDVSGKGVTRRRARASGAIQMQPATLQLIVDQAHAKGDVVEVARLAGIMATKRTSELIPLCHPLPIDGVQVDLRPTGDSRLAIEATVEVEGKTGVEMEALTAVSVAALTVYDMCKAIDREMTIEDIRLEEKSGGASGDFRRSE